MPKIKLIFFDMEGVIFESGVIENRKGIAASIWSVLPKHLAEGAVETSNKGTKMWAGGKFKNYVEWMEYSIENHRKHGLTKDVFSRIISKVQYMNGVKETIEELKKKGYRTAMITGGFKNLANSAIRDLGLDHTFAACEYFFDENSGRLTHWNLLPADYEGKANFMDLMMKEYGINPGQCAFIGDGVNDIPLAKKVGMSIAFNARKELREVTTHSINQKQKDLRAILKFFK